MSGFQGIDYSASGGVMGGNLRDSVLYQTFGEGEQSEYGDSAETWSEGTPLWSLVEILEGSQLLAAKQMHAQAKARITIRYNASVVPFARFVWQSENYYIHSAVADPLKRRMVCICFTRPEEAVN